MADDGVTLHRILKLSKGFEVRIRDLGESGYVFELKDIFAHMCIMRYEGLDFHKVAQRAWSGERPDALKERS